jgi:hypothetical protein
MTRSKQILISVGLALVALACYDDDRHLPTDPGTTRSLALEASPSSIPADGFSRTTITARIDPRTATTNRGITFTTTAGAFVGFTPPTPAVVTADVTGMAMVDLRSSRDVGDAAVSATAGSVTRTIHIAFTAAEPSATIQVSTSAPAAPADGASITQVFADIAPELPAEDRTVTFTSTLGIFVTTQATTAMARADGSNRATVDLKSPTNVGSTRLTGTVTGVTAETLLQYVPAPPHSIQLSAVPDMLDVKANAVVTIAATLRRIIGSVTDGIRVTYTAVDETGGPIGAFFNPRPSTAGESSVRFSPNGTAYRGLVTIRATADGSDAVGELALRVVDP